MSPDSPPPPRNSTISTAASVASYCERQWTFLKRSIRQKLSEKKLFECYLTFSKGENTLFLFACLKISKKNTDRLRNIFAWTVVMLWLKERFLLAQESTLNSNPKKRYLTKTVLQSAFSPRVYGCQQANWPAHIAWGEVVEVHSFPSLVFPKERGERRPPHTIPWPLPSPQTIFFLGRQVLLLPLLHTSAAAAAEFPGYEIAGENQFHPPFSPTCENGKNFRIWPCVGSIRRSILACQALEKEKRNKKQYLGGFLYF